MVTTRSSSSSSASSASSSSSAAAVAVHGREQDTTPAPAITFVPPRGADWVSFCGVALYFGSAAVVYGRGLGLGDGAGAGGAIAWLVRRLLWPVVAIHAAETAWLAHSRLARAGVPCRSRVWWLWIASVFFEGFTAFRRWDAVVGRRRAPRKSA